MVPAVVSDPDGRVEPVFETVGGAATAAERVCRAVAELTAGMGWLADLTAATLGEVPVADRLAALAGLERLATLVPLAQARVLACVPVAEPEVRRVRDPGTGAVRTRVVMPGPDTVTPQEVSLALGCPVELARDRVVLAGELADLPAATAAARSGALRWWQLRRVADAVVGLDPVARAVVDQRVADDAAAGRSAARFTARLRRAVLAAAPPRAEAAHEAAFADRGVTVRPAGSGMAWFGARLAAEDALTVAGCLDALASTPLAADPQARGVPAVDPLAPETSRVDDRTADNRRADALVGLCRSVLDRLADGLDPVADSPVASANPVASGAAPTTDADGAVRGSPRRRSRRRRSAEIVVVVSAETLLGVSEDPGELLGHGPLTARHARRIAHRAGSTWRRMLTDPMSGAVLDRGRTTYAAPAELSAHVLARGGWQCARPGCGHRAVDLDHATAWEDLGRTAENNMSGLCGGCHTAKHTGWEVAVDPDGTTRWRTRHGLRAVTAPADLRPEDRVRPPRVPPRVATGVRLLPAGWTPDSSSSARPAPDGSTPGGWLAEIADRLRDGAAPADRPPGVDQSDARKPTPDPDPDPDPPPF